MKINIKVIENGMLPEYKTEGSAGADCFARINEKVIVKPKTVIDEVEKNGEKMGRKRLYIVMIKYIALIMLVILFLKSIGVLTII